MALIELAPGVTEDEIAAKTEATYQVTLNEPREAMVAG
jgi:acyl CoA:acetate/3-ketoacid CoA transferase beta subunit